MNKFLPKRPNRERGVTLPLMAFAMVVVLGMAALSIDVATLYLAKSEAQRAADAAAMAAARAFVLTGTTTDVSTDFQGQTVATTLAQQQALAALETNLIAGRPGQLVPPLTVTMNFGAQTNPTVSLTVEQTALPTFFSRIWTRAAYRVSATAVAEAYNPWASSSNPAVNVRCVKPFIVPNADPGHPIASTFEPFINVGGGADGTLKNPGRAAPNGTGIIGERLVFKADCPRGGCSNSNNVNPPVASVVPPTTLVLDFVPANLPSASSGISCPGCAGRRNQFDDDISCCNTVQMACNTQSGNPVTVNPGNPMAVGTLTNSLQCLIHKSLATGMDSLDTTGFPTVAGSPFRFVVGSLNPLVTGPNHVVNTGDLVNTSDSLITLMIYDGSVIPPSGVVNIIGYMQVFIEDENGSDQFTGTILNIAGCGDAARANTIQGGGASPIAVRLIHN